MRIYDNIKEIAAIKGISIAQIERVNDFSNGSISKWNSSIPSADKLAAVAKHLNVSSDFLLGLTQEMKDLQGKPIANLEDDSAIFAFDGKPVSGEEREFLKSVIETYRKNKK